MKAFWVQMIDLDLFFDISRDVAMATNFVKKMAKSPHSSLWHFEMEWDITTCINSVNDASMSCKNYVNFGQLTPELRAYL